MSECYITHSVLTGLLDELKKIGIHPPKDLLERLEQKRFVLNNLEYIPIKEFINLLSYGCNASDDDFLSWNLGAEFKFSYMGELGTVLQGSNSLGETLKIFCQCFRLFKTWSYLDLDIQKDIVILKYKVLDREYWARDLDEEFTLSFLLSLIEYYVQNKIYINSINFESAPRPIGNYLTHRYRSEVTFNNISNQIVFPASYLDSRKEPSQSAIYNNLIIKHLSSDLEIFLNQNSFSEVVRYEIFKLIDYKTIDQKTISEVLNMSQRSLRRNLFLEGATFKEQVEFCRSTQAKNSLNHTSLPFSEIAFRLGYSDQSAFSRACMRWFQMSPAAIRANCKIKQPKVFYSP